MLALSDFVALFALLISVFSAWFTYRAYAHSSATGAIRSQYDAFTNMMRAQIDHSQLIHLFTVPDSYASVLQQVRASLNDLSKEDRLKILLQERATADYIFNEFEQAFYQFNRARSYLDEKSSAFYAEVLDYYSLRLLRNPRLLYYWSLDGGQLCLNLEPGTISFYEANVLNHPTHPLMSWPDPIGPFGDLMPDSTTNHRNN